MLGAMCVLLLAGLWAPVTRAEDYVLGIEDVVAVSVWLHPELERQLAINSAGDIIMPPVGEIRAAGLTPKALGDRISDKLSSYLRTTTAVTVTVSQYLSRSVFVSGAVAKPGRYGFEKIPGIVDVLGQAGGALAGADLARIEIIRREGEMRRSVPADVASALRDGVVSGLPELKAGDTVVVPAMSALGTNAGGEGVGLIGEVGRPGLYPIGGGQDLWALLAAAGGVTARGDLSSVRVITHQGTGQAVLTLNLRDALQRGSRSPFVVHNGDVVYVASNADKAAGKALAGFEQVLSVSRDVLGLVLIKNALNGRGNP
jgi:polysaccharide export outer membrane protein